MKITSIGHGKIYPSMNGYAQVSYYPLMHLSEKFNIVLIGHSGKITSPKRYIINDNFNIIEVPGLITAGIGALGYFLTKKPLFDPVLAWACTHSRHLLKCYLEHANESDILIFEGCWHFPLLNKVRNTNEKLIVYHAHNVEYLLKKQVYSGIFERKLLPRIYALEKRACQESDIVLTTCDEERESFLNLYGIDRVKTHVMPNGISLPQGGRKTVEKTILFIGGAYFANFEAAKFINDVLAEKLSEFKFRIAGRCCMAITNPKKNVLLYGFVFEEEKDGLLRTSELAINPILHGAGVNVKLLEYMAYGIPTVTTQLGARGIEYEENYKPFFISDLDNFAESIKLLHANQGLAEKLATNSRRLIAEKYEWGKVTEGIAEIIIAKYNEKTK